MPRPTPLQNDEQWKKLEPLLPKMAPGKKGGRPWTDNRQVLEGILWVLKTGARWRDLPEVYPSPATCWRRLKLWEDLGIWLDVWRALLSELDEQQYLDWEETFADGSFAPAKKGGPASGRRNVEKVRSGWWWSTARVFLWEAHLLRPRRRKSSSSRRPSSK